MSTWQLVRAKPFSVSSALLFILVDVFGTEYLRAPNAQDMARLLAINVVVSLACLTPLIACIKSGRTVLQFGMDSSKDTRTPQLFLKPFQTRRRGFGMLSLKCQGLAITPMLFRGHRSLPS
jgi:hypothetical protein